MAWCLGHHRGNFHCMTSLKCDFLNLPNRKYTVILFNKATGIKVSQTGDQPYKDTSPYGECSLSGQTHEFIRHKTR